MLELGRLDGVRRCRIIGAVALVGLEPDSGTKHRLQRRMLDDAAMRGTDICWLGVFLLQALPFERLRDAAMRAGEIEDALIRRLIARRDPAGALHARRRDVDDLLVAFPRRGAALSELGGIAAAVDVEG